MAGDPKLGSETVSPSGGRGHLPLFSVIIPVHNEADNLPGLHQDLVDVAGRTGCTWEILYINDGSLDGSDRVLDDLAAESSQVRVLHLARNFGQTAAMAAGFDHSKGRWIIPMDADRQNDPSALHLMLSPAHAEIADEFLKDLADAAKNHGESRGKEARYS